jgi:hypothetical protein
LDNITPFPARDLNPPPMRRSRLQRQLLASTVVDLLAYHVHESDQALGIGPAIDQQFHTVVGPLRASIVERATIAVQLGDPVKRVVADEQAAAMVLHSVRQLVSSGQLSRVSALAELVRRDRQNATDDVRLLAKVAVNAALQYLAGIPIGGKES